MDLSLLIQVALVSSVRDFTMLNQIFVDLNIHHPIISNNEIFNDSDSFQCFFFYRKAMDCKNILIQGKFPFRISITMW